METDRVKLLKYQRIINMSLKNKLEKGVDSVLGGLTKLIQHSDQDHILAEAIKTVCNFLFCSSFFSEEDKRFFILTLNEEAQRYGWDLIKK
jgi:hypothetical protein